jgi:type I restriction enzyme M protein
MTRQEFKNTIDNLWEKFWTGGITNPLSVIEQITYLIFLKMLDEREIKNENRKRRTKEDIPTLFADFETSDGKIIKGTDARWSKFTKSGSAQTQLETVRDVVFPFLRQCKFSDTSSGKFLKDAVFLINKPTVLDEAINIINKLPLDDDDIKGNLYEYLLSKLSTSGINGQFRTPRHIIDMIVKLVDPQIGEKITDPMCGTAGFLVQAYSHLLKTNTSKTGIVKRDGYEIYTADKLNASQRNILNNNSLYGFDFDASMLRVASMNLLLHGVDNPNIEYQDAFSSNFHDRHPEFSKDAFDIILANPPFKGSLDFEDVSPDILKQVKTKKTEVLSIPFFLRLLKTGGRAGIIVPAGVLSTENNAYVKARKLLIEDNQLDAVITMPSGVFKPYAGVSTAVLLFSKEGRTDNVWFYEMANDGKSLDDKRSDIKENDIPEIIESYKNKKEIKGKSFLVSKEKLQKESYSLLPSRYKEIEYKAKVFDKTPIEMLENIMKLEKKSNDLVKGLYKQLGGKL